METKIYKMQEKIEQAELKAIATLLRKGETVAFPTETVYGLGADATNEAAIAKIFTAKGRPSDNPLIVHVATKEQLFSLVKNVPAYVADLVDGFSPGPITYVLRNAQKVAPTVTAGLETVGVRIPNHPVALAILEASNRPVAAPSANRSGRPSPTEADHVVQDLSGRIAAIVDGGRTDVGIESTVVDCTGDVPLILRPGAITQVEIASLVGACEVYEAASEEKPKSPGMKYVHYAPEVPLLLVSSGKITQVLKRYEQEGNRVALLYESESLEHIPVAKKELIGADESDIAQGLYRLLRKFTKQEVDLIICEYPSLGEENAIIDRLKRAATEIIR